VKEGKERTKQWRKRIEINGGRSLSVMLDGETSNMLVELKDYLSEKESSVIRNAIHILHQNIFNSQNDKKEMKNKKQPFPFLILE